MSQLEFSCPNCLLASLPALRCPKPQWIPNRRYHMFFQDTEKNIATAPFWCSIVFTLVLHFFIFFLHIFTKYCQISQNTTGSTPSEIYDNFSQVSHVFLTSKLWSWSIWLLFLHNTETEPHTESSVFAVRLSQTEAAVFFVVLPQPHRTSKKGGISGHYKCS